MRYPGTHIERLASAANAEQPTSQTARAQLSHEQGDSCDSIVGVDIHADSPIGMVLAFLTLHRGVMVRASSVRPFAAELRLKS